MMSDQKFFKRCNEIGILVVKKNIIKKNIMRCKTLLSLAFSIIFLCCKKEKEKIIYTGEVISQPNYCTSSTGFPFIIKYLDKMSHSDTIITITLPIQYKFIGQKIKFEIRDLTSQDERIACTNLFIIPKQVIIFNVSQQ